MDEKSAAVLESKPSALTWVRTEEFCYEAPVSTAAPKADEQERLCFCCGKQPATKRCAKCQVASYCGRDCQVKDWKTKHKASCESYQRVGPDMCALNGQKDKQAEARRDIFQRVRFYACAYAVHQASTLGRGFLFLQSDKTLAALSLSNPQDAWGRPIMNRSVLLHYLTMGEYDGEVCRDDFEMATIRSNLKDLVDKYDEQSQLVLLMRFRCGHVAIGSALLVPEYNVCKQLGKQYFGDSAPPSLQLNIDDA